MQQHNHGRFVDTRLHRPAFTLDDSCAMESAWLRANAESNAPDLYEMPKITQPTESPPPAGPIYWLVVAASMMSFSVFLGWHVLASWAPQIAKALGVAS